MNDPRAEKTSFEREIRAAVRRVVGYLIFNPTYRANGHKLRTIPLPGEWKDTLAPREAYCSK